MAGDVEATNELVKLVGVDDPTKWNEATELYSKIADLSATKLVATQAMVLIEIRKGRFKEAGRLLSAQTKELGSSPVPLKLGHEKLMLWLLLEVESPKAEPQLKRLVSTVVKTELHVEDRKDACKYLGLVLGMLRAAGDSTCVSSETIDSEKAVIESIESRSTAELFRLGLEEASQWNSDLSAQTTGFESQPMKHAQELITSLKQRREAAIEELSAINDRAKATTIRKNYLASKKSEFDRQLRLETPGRPSEPKEPQPKRRSSSSSSSKAKDKDELEMPTPADLREYEIKKAQYPILLERWKQSDAIRRTWLNDQKAANEPQFMNLVRDLNNLVEEVKEETKIVADLHRKVSIASIALERTSAGNAKLKSLARSSNFLLLDFESEVLRLQRCMRMPAR